MTVNPPTAYTQYCQATVPFANAAQIVKRHKMPYIPPKKRGSKSVKLNKEQVKKRILQKKRAKRKAQNKARAVMSFYSQIHYFKYSYPVDKVVTGLTKCKKKAWLWLR